MLHPISENKKKVTALLDSNFVTEPTRKRLLERLNENGTNIFFNDEDYLLLNKICDLLIDQNSEDRSCHIALAIDKRLANKEADGWRYDVLPPDNDKYSLGLKGINEISEVKFNQFFINLNEEQQIEILLELQLGTLKTETWQILDSKLFFEDLLAESAEIYYSHPIVQLNIDYVGMADADGWRKIKLNEFEEPEKKDT